MDGWIKDGWMDGGQDLCAPPPPNNVFVGGRHPPSPKDTEQNESIVWVARRGGHRGYPRSKGGAVLGWSEIPTVRGAMAIVRGGREPRPHTPTVVLEDPKFS